MKKNILIVDGSLGVGLALAQHYVRDGHSVTIASPTDAGCLGARFHSLSISEDTFEMANALDGLAKQVGDVQTLIYCADFVQHGPIAALEDVTLA
ncbi:hypothetical protein [Phaeobacter sp. C3_T13_0]|uniref:hypothetical protein n=1 Tax=Phaeobacter cretensis TaxID=3342641 RepID=UPI0039BC79C5